MHTFKEAYVAVELAQAWMPSVVCQGSLWRAAPPRHWWMICQDRVPLMPTSSLLRRGTREGEGTEVISAMAPDVWVFACLAECVLFWQPLANHVNGIAEALHVSVVWGQGVGEMASSTGLNTLTSEKPWGAPSCFNGKNLWSVSDSDQKTYYRNNTNLSFPCCLWSGGFAWVSRITLISNPPI